MNEIKNRNIIVLLINGSNISAKILDWGINLWGQKWAILQRNTSDNTVIHVNLAHIISFIVQPSENKNDTNTEKISRSLPDDKKVVKEPEVEFKATSLDPKEQAESLVELYNKKKQLLAESIKDRLSNKELKGQQEVYAMPSFKKRTTPKT